MDIKRTAKPKRTPIDRIADLLIEAEPTRQLHRIKRLLAGRSFKDELRRKVQGKRILVTGASSGVGRSAALSLLEAGAHVLLVARRSDKLQEVAIEAAEFDGTAFIYTCDLSDDDDRENLIAQVIKELINAFLSVLEDGQKRGVLVDTVPLHILFDVFMGFISRLGIMHTTRQSNEPLIANFDALFAMLWRSMSKA